MNVNDLSRENHELQRRIFWAIARKSLVVIPDITVKAGNYQWTAHSNLILQQSAHFRRIRDTDTKESKNFIISHSINFDEDQPQLVARMLAWLNGSPNYNGSCATLLHPMHPPLTFHDFMACNRIDSNQPADHACETVPTIVDQIDLFLFALKYEMPALADACVLAIEIALNKCSAEEVISTLRHVHTLNSTVCSALMIPLARVTSVRYQSLQAIGGDLNSFFLDHPYFAIQVMLCMQQQSRSPGGNVMIKTEPMMEIKKQEVSPPTMTPVKNTTKAAAAKKRKVGE